MHKIQLNLALRRHLRAKVLKTFSTAHSRVDYLCHVSLKSIH